MTILFTIAPWLFFNWSLECMIYICTYCKCYSHYTITIYIQVRLPMKSLYLFFFLVFVTDFHVYMYQIFSNLWICSEIVNKKKINLFILYLVHIDIHTCVVFRICNKIKINIYVMFMFNYIMFNMYLVLVGFLYPFCVIKLRYLYVDTFSQYLQL